MKLKIFFLSLFLIAALSCRKEDMTIPINTDETLLTRIKVSDQPYYQYIYNSSNLITAENSKYIFSLHRYNENDQLLSTDYFSDIGLMSIDSVTAAKELSRKEWVTSSNSPKGASITYEYNVKGQLAGTTFLVPSGSSKEYTLFTYDVNKRIGKQSIYWGDKLSGYIIFLYDDNGNLTKETLYSISSKGIAELKNTTQYEFDNYQNPFRSISKLAKPGINTNRNNIIRQTFTIHHKPEQGPDVVQVSVYSYVYNSSGYPVRKNATIEYIY